MKPRQTEREQIEHFPSSVLFDLARNEAARWEARKAAATVLIDRVDPRSKHPELSVLVQQIASEVMDGTQNLPGPGQTQFDWKSEAVEGKSLRADSESDAGPLRASVTTKTMFGGPTASMDQILEEFTTASPAPALVSEDTVKPPES